MITRAVTKATWVANASWLTKFVDYIKSKCPRRLKRRGLKATAMSLDVALAFLAAVNKDKPHTKTCVDSAKRAVNH